MSDDPMTRFLDLEAELERRGADAHAKGAQAFARLLDLAETRDSGQIGRVATLVPDGDQRVLAVLARWGIEWPETAPELEHERG